MQSTFVENTKVITFAAVVVDREFPKFSVEVGGETFDVDCSLRADVKITAATSVSVIGSDYVSELAQAYALDAQDYLNSMMRSHEVTPRTLAEFVGGDTLAGMIAKEITRAAWSDAPADLSEA